MECKLLGDRNFWVVLFMAIFPVLAQNLHNRKLINIFLNELMNKWLNLHTIFGLWSGLPIYDYWFILKVSWYNPRKGRRYLNSLDSEHLNCYFLRKPSNQTALSTICISVSTIVPVCKSKVPNNVKFIHLFYFIHLYLFTPFWLHAYPTMTKFRV